MIAIRSFFLTLLLGLLPSKVWAQEQCNPPPPVLVFGNGMLNSYDEAADSLTSLVKRIRSEKNRHQFLRKWIYIPKRVLAYNFNELFFFELLQVSEQASKDADTHHLLWLRDVANAPDWFQEEASSRYARITEASVQGDRDAKGHVKDYMKLIEAGESIVVVAHSQGNFYANTTLSYVAQHMPYLNNGVLQLFSVATPASYVFKNGPYVTLTSDRLIRAIPGSLPANTTNYNSGLFDHAFVLKYLNGDASGPKILDDLNTLFSNAIPVPEKMQTGEFDSVSYINKDIGHMWYFERQIIHGYSKILSDAECLSLMAFEQTYNWWGETCETRGLATLTKWLDDCYSEEWSEPSQFAFDCALYDLPPAYSATTGMIVGMIHPECVVTMDNIHSKITQSTVDKAKEILSDPGKVAF